MFTNPVFLSVIIMIVLCLFKLNVILSLMLAAIAGGVLAGMPLGGANSVMEVFIGGMGRNAETALSYILLGALAAAIHKTGLTEVLSKSIVKIIKGKSIILVLVIAAVSCLSQNVIPVHIAFIPILIPPLLEVMNRLKIDRRAVATALTFGLKAPYVALPFGYGWIFHGIISREMGSNGMEIATEMVWRGMWFPGLSMVIGLLIAVFFVYNKPRDYKDIQISSLSEAAAATEIVAKSNTKTLHLIGGILGAISALVVQIKLGSLPLGAIVGLIIMFAFGAIKWKDIDKFIESGIGMMGFIAFVMLVASGYGSVIRATGGVDALVDSATGIIGGSKFVGATIMIIIGLFITMGIGTSFGTIPIIAAIYVPLASAIGFSPLATVVLIGTAAALGDAGSPASDSTLGPTAGLNADGQHDHIWDTCVPTFIFYNIPLVIFGIIGAMIF